MPKYLFQVSYTAEGVRALRAAGAESRVKAGRDAATSLGGTLEAFYFAFGENDVVAIVDLPDDEAAAAISLAGAESGVLTGRTTKLLTAAQVDDAMSRSTNWRPPGQ